MVLFKVGDRVICISNAFRTINQGQIYTILEIRDSKNYRVTPYGVFFDERNFVPATPLMETLS